MFGIGSKMPPFKSHRSGRIFGITSTMASITGTRLMVAVLYPVKGPKMHIITGSRLMVTILYSV